MRHVIIRAFGPPDTMAVECFTATTPDDHEVMIEVSACGVNFPDLAIRLGISLDAPTLPHVPGYEVSGRIVERGRNVTDFQVGDRVFAMIPGGGYATHVTCRSDQLFHVPPDMSDDEASVISISYLTAWLSVNRLAGVRAGEIVVIHSAGGGVGLAALQLCVTRGAHVIAIAGENKHARLQFVGADACIDPSKEDITARLRELTNCKGVDVILDSTGGQSYNQSYQSLSPLGRLVLLGSAGVISESETSPLQSARFRYPPMQLSPPLLMKANKSISGLHLPPLLSCHDICVEGMAEILSLYENGYVMPIIDAVFSLDDASEAHRHLHARNNFGKVVLHP
ncbi:NADPH:quinone reductase-like Zn-dependent oxidoreductase [Herbaspirillum seropedicae]|uniref:quinone oxidoreductase family protein n=1 Tax=Herbaspirillum seropedicae TaxID=964 RepID=UPI003397216C